MTYARAVMYASEAAESVRATTFGRRLPLDPVLVARSLGFAVVDATLPGHVAAAISKKSGNDPVILLSSRDSVNRKRVACAHELGHLIAFGEDGDDRGEYVHIDLRGSVLSTCGDSEDQFANEFAAELLMPADALSRLRYGGATRIEMMLRFGVTPEAVNYRVNQLGLA